jgi:hypothetical protein
VASAVSTEDADKPHDLAPGTTEGHGIFSNDQEGVTKSKETGTMNDKRQFSHAETAVRRSRPVGVATGLLVALVVAFLAGCASTKVTDRNQVVSGPLPRPNTIWVYDFAATPDDVPSESSLAGQYSAYSTPQNAEQIATGRKVGDELATELVEQINAIGMYAAVAGPETHPAINDIVIHGYLLSIVQGDTDKRVLVGLGAGDAELKVAVEGFEVTASGLRKLGSGSTDATGNKTPGAGVGLLTLLATHNPAGLIVSTGMKVYDEKTGRSGIEGRVKSTAKEIADVLKKRFQQEGWIS